MPEPSSRFPDPFPADTTARDRRDGAPGSHRATTTAVLVVSDVRLLRDGLTQAIDATPRMHVVGAAASLADAITAVAGLHPDLVLLDTSMRGALEIAREVRRTAPETPLVAFAVDDEDDTVLAGIEAGVTAYVPRHAGIDTLVATLGSAARGEALCSPRVVGSLFRRQAVLADAREVPRGATEPLTARERQVARLIEQGLSNKEIARELLIEVPTVKNHVHRVLEKLRVARRGQIGRAARATTGPASASPPSPRP